MNSINLFCMFAFHFIIKRMRPSLIICCLFLFLQSFSQTTNSQQKINNLLEDYFHYDRENIHVQFNKMLYVNTEYIGFKGYVFNKNTNLPHLNTTNVQLVIYNEKQEIIEKKLLFTTNGTFNGNLRLTEKFTSGKYYFHFYTNWMNNFKEDDSFIQTIEVIDRNSTYNLKSKLPNYETVSVQLFPESGIIIDGINNNIGVKIRDCNQVGIQITNGVITDSKSNEITQFSTNKMGYGKFNFIPDINETYFLKIISDKLNISQQLPKTQPTGIAISYNDNLPKNIVAIDIKTNNKGVNLYQNKKFILLIHQNKDGLLDNVSFENKEPDQIIKFDKKRLSNGINTIRVLDEDLNEVAERLLYYDKTSKVNIELESKNSVNDSISLHGKIEAKLANISISVLPEDNSCIVQNRSILGTFLLNAYLEQPEINNSAYFDIENNSRKNDMELLMLNQNKSKYQWENIISGTPKINFKFKKGLTLNGTVEKALNAKENYKISLFSMKNKVWEETNVEKDNKFKFENFYVKDSTVFIFQLVNNKNDSYKCKITAQTESIYDPFILKPNFELNNCPPIKNSEISFNFKNVNFDKKTIELSEVKITNNSKKDNLKYQNELDNSFANAYKIKEGQYGTFLNFLNFHGYSAGIDEGSQSVYISNRKNGSLRNDTSRAPTVFIDNEKMYDLDVLHNLDMSEIDEVYLDDLGSSAGGTIKIYLRKGTNKDFYNPKFSSFIITSGFSKSDEYKNSIFSTKKEFNNFGTLSWNPNVVVSENQDFKVIFPKENQKVIEVLIEGFTPEGQLISEIKKL